MTDAGPEAYRGESTAYAARLLGDSRAPAQIARLIGRYRGRGNSWIADLRASLRKVEGAKPKPSELLAEALGALEGRPAVKATFRTSIRRPGSDPLETTGTAWWTPGRGLLTELTASGGLSRKFARAGGKTRVWNDTVEAWIDAADAGLAEAAIGLQDPSRAIELARLLAGQAKAGKADGEVTLAVSGAELKSLVGPADGVDWEQVRATATLRIEKGRLVSFACSAEAAGSVKIAATLDLEEVEAGARPAWTIPPPEE